MRCLTNGVLPLMHVRLIYCKKKGPKTKQKKARVKGFKNETLGLDLSIYLFKHSIMYVCVPEGARGSCRRHAHDVRG